MERSDHCGQRKVGLLLTFIFLISANPSFSSNCSDLDSSVNKKISAALCDTLSLLQDEDYACVRINIRGLVPPSGHPSDQWFADNLALVSARADSVIAQYDLRTIADASVRITTINAESLPAINCMVKKSVVFNTASSSCVESVEKYFKPEPLLSVPSVPRILRESNIQKCEYYTLAGQRIMLDKRANKATAHLSEILIAVEYSPEGRIITKRINNSR
jgi:hypothetical protein